MMDSLYSTIDRPLRQEIHVLALACLESTATTDQRSRLQQLVCEDRAVRQWYVQYMHDSLTLRRLGTAELKHSHGELGGAWFDEGGQGDEEAAWSDDDLTGNDSSNSDKDLRSPVSGDSSPMPWLSIALHDTVAYFSRVAPRCRTVLVRTLRGGHESVTGRLSLSIVVSALVVGSMLMLLALWAAPSFRAWRVQQEVTVETPVATEAVARLTGMVDVAWAPGTPERALGSPVPQDEPITVSSGLFEIQFDKGTKVVVEGPATFIARQRNEGYLSRGKLVAHVPRRASGFKLKTPQATIVDLGTEFGVNVDESGRTDVHVFQGCVLAELNGTEDSGKSVSRVLAANESVQLDAAKGTIDVLPSSDSQRPQYVRTLPKPRRKPKQGVTGHLALVNPSFEQPDIRKHVKPNSTALLQTTVLGWYTGTLPPASAKQAYYLLSTQDAAYRNGRGATDGRQVASLWLRDMLPGEKVQAAWMYQSLGVVDKTDVGKQLTAAVDVAAKSWDRGSNTPPKGGGAAVDLAFAVGVSNKSLGDTVGNVGSWPSLRQQDAIQTLDANLTVSEDLVGHELFLRIAISGPALNIDRDIYHVDNVRCVVGRLSDNGSALPANRAKTDGSPTTNADGALRTAE